MRKVWPVWTAPVSNADVSPEPQRWPRHTQSRLFSDLTRKTRIDRLARFSGTTGQEVVALVVNADTDPALLVDSD
jgi:hypothetical protein